MDHALNINGEWTMLGVPSLLDLAGCLCKTRQRAGGSAASGGGNIVQACHDNIRGGKFIGLGHTEREIMVRSLKPNNSGAASQVLAPQRVCCFNQRGGRIQLLFSSR